MEKNSTNPFYITDLGSVKGRNLSGKWGGGVENMVIGKPAKYEFDLGFDDTPGRYLDDVKGVISREGIFYWRAELVLVGVNPETKVITPLKAINWGWVASGPNATPSLVPMTGGGTGSPTFLAALRAFGNGWKVAGDK